MSLNPTKSRADELRSLGRRSVAAVDAAAPAVDVGYDVTEWDQVLLVVSGDAAGVAELLIYAQYGGFIGASEGVAMVPMSYLRAVPLLNHTSTYRGNAVFVVNTMKADRIFPAVITFSGATAVYLNVLGLTAKGAPLVAGAGVQGEDDADVFDVVDIVKVGGQTLAAHGAAATTVPVLGGAKATANDPTAVDENDVALLSVTLGSRLRTQSAGVAAHGAAASGNPVLGGAKANAADPAAVDENDVVNLSATLASRLRVQSAGVADHGAAVSGNPVLVAAKATAAEPVAVDEGDVADLSTNLTGRLRVDAIGNVASDAADSGNPIKIGFKAEQTLITAVADGDRVDGVADLYGRQYTHDGIAGDDVAAANRGAVNTHADDRDESPQTLLTITDDTTDPDYGPSTAGYEVGNRTWLTIHLRIRDGAVTFESSNDGTNWEDTTASVVDRNTGAGGYASFSEPDAATVDFLLETWVGARYWRLKWDPANATSIIVSTFMARVP